MLIKPIKFDLNKYRLYEKLKAKQGDTESRFLLFQLLDGSLPFNLENRSVRAYMIKPDGKEVFNDLIINDRVKGYCTLELTNQVLAAPGIVKLELMVTEGTKKLTSSVFELEVDKSINSEKSIVSTNEFGALLKGLASLNEYDNYKNEIAEARDGEKNLLTKVKKIDEQLETIEPKIEFNEFPQEIQGVIINDNYIGVMPLDFIDGVLYGFKNNTTLVKSSDDGITWEDIIRIPFGSVMCIFKCADGEMLIGNNGQLVKTIGWEINPKTCTFSQNKLPNKTPGVGTLRWGIDGDGIKFIVTEYSGSDRGESRYIWVSTDMGNTFNVVYDKYTTDPTNTSHMHGVCYDKWADRFFVSHGHGVLRGVYYSDNDGVTWNKISGNFQPDAAPTTLIATDDGIVCGSDSADGGLYGILRTEKPEDMEMRKICRWNVEREGVTGFAFKSVRDKRGHVYVSFKSDFDDVPSVIMAGTANSATTVWTSPTKEANSFLYLGVTDKKIIGVTLKGAIYKKIEGFKKVGKQSYQFDKGNMNYGESRIATSINVGTGREITTFRETVVGCKAGVMPGVSGSNNVIIGFDAHANARSVVIGSEAMSDKNDTVSIGKGTSCQGIFGTAIGVGANVMNNATNGTAIGSKATSFVNGTAIGSEASASEGSANGATAIGSNAKAGSFSTAIGNNAQAKGVNQMAIGKGAISTHTNSIALGIGVTTTTTDQLAIGKKHIELDVLDNDPVSVPDNKARLYIIKNTSGKIELRVRIGGNNIVLATQP